jgi:hypothetical protein
MFLLKITSPVLWVNMGLLCVWSAWSGKNMNIFIISEEYDLLYMESWFWELSFRSEMTSGVDLKNGKNRHPRGECY